MKTPKTKTDSTTTKVKKATTRKGKTAKANFTTVNNICAMATKDMTGIGTFYNQADAKKRLDDYFSATGNSPHDKKLVFGQLFGISMVQKLLDWITAINNDPTTIKKLTGIRVYNAMSVRPDLPAPDNGKLLPDVVFVPVYEDGFDILPVHEVMGVFMSLSGGMPCPNECGTGFYLQ
jgi:hypothetical protein